jgi:hypothetical protein
MSKPAMSLLCLALSASAASVARGDASTSPSVRFETIDVYVDSGSTGLGAYQFEFHVVGGNAEVVGVEGGATPAYAAAPYYDPSALRGGSLIVAAFQAEGTLPSGRTRVATLHLMVRGDRDPDYDLKLVVAADQDGNSIPGDITFEKGDAR